MIRWASYAKSVRWSLLEIALLLAVAAGCGRGEKAGATVEDTTSGKATPETAVAAPAGNSAQIQKVAFDPRLHQSFVEATVGLPPEDQVRPPDLTMTGKSVGKLYQQIAGNKGKGGLWEQVKFVTPDGKRIRYSATIKTDQGDMTMELYSDIAPNHVRNFVALARAGYYNGLQFDRAVRENVPTAPGKVHEYLEAGCPVGTGEAIYGSIGYWLKPEISDKIKHEVGTVGAVRGADIESAACKFYITLNKAEWIDGQYTIFGKITDGLDVARKIFNRPKVAGLPDHPQNPVLIREVVIHTQER